MKQKRKLKNQKTKFYTHFIGFILKTTLMKLESTTLKMEIPIKQSKFGARLLRMVK